MEIRLLQDALAQILTLFTHIGKSYQARSDRLVDSVKNMKLLLITLEYNA